MAELVVKDLVVTFGRGASAFHAVNHVSLTVPNGSIVGLVGESGSGKSTLARTIAGLQPATSGHLLLDGTELRRPHGRSRRQRARDVQMIFQDPYSSLNPRMTVGDTLDEALAAHSDADASQRRQDIDDLLGYVRLKPGIIDQYPSQLSGGMRQRVAIARCLAVKPRLIVADEITSALDASVQGAVLNLVKDLQRELGLSVLFITHNLAAVRYIADTTAVMSKGEIVEHGETVELVSTPRHPYTRSLISAIPRIHHAGSDFLLNSIGEP